MSEWKRRSEDGNDDSKELTRFTIGGSVGYENGSGPGTSLVEGERDASSRSVIASY